MIEYCVQHINPLDAIEPMPGNNALVERQEYAQLEQDLQGTIAVRDAKITAAQSDVEERNLEADRARIVQEDTQYLESMHWAVSEADIQKYRGRMNDFAVLYSFTADEAEERRLNGLHEKLSAGDIDAQTYASSLDRAITMSKMEDE